MMKVDEAFTALKQALIDELREAKQEGQRAFEESEFESAQDAARRGASAGEILQQVEELAELWPTYEERINSSPVIKDPEQPLRRAASGSGSQKDDFVLPILQALQELGGKGTARQVIDQIGAILDPSIKNGQPDSNGWRLAVQTASAAMVKKGYISATSPEGEWKLTTKGRLYFFEQQ
jgi:hypothetical protein